jgi:hypothetical protein
MRRDSFIIERAHRDKIQRVDVRRFTKDLYVDFVAAVMTLVTEISPNGGVKPVEVAAAVYDLTSAEKSSLNSRVRRVRLFAGAAGSDGAGWSGLASGVAAQGGFLTQSGHKAG